MYRLTFAFLLLITYSLPAEAQLEIEWIQGPTAVNVGSESKIDVPSNCQFTHAAGTRRFLELTENPSSGNELGVLYCEPADEYADAWFVLFTFDASGYVRDDEGRELDADAILKSIRRGTELANEERRKRGWETVSITGWITKPYYDRSTNNLTWSISANSPSGEITVNHSVRMLGRGGVMHVDLVAGPDQLATEMTAFNSVVASHSFVSGRRYAEFREGDKLATYGLTALVAGGAGAVAMKTGILAKFWKLLILPFVALFAWLKSLFARREEGVSEQ
jgi:uncharacterized membrane-anchored protein